MRWGCSSCGRGVAWRGAQSVVDGPLQLRVRRLAEVDVLDARVAKVGADPRHDVAALLGDELRLGGPPLVGDGHLKGGRGRQHGVCARVCAREFWCTRDETI